MGRGSGGVEGLLSSYKNTNTMERHNRACKSKLIDTFPHYRAVKHMHTRRLYGNTMGRVQAPLTSHISCMTAFHHRGRLDQEVRSYLCEFLTAKCCWNGRGYFLALLWHHETKQLPWINGRLLCGNFQYMCEQTSLTCLGLWHDEGTLKTFSLCWSVIKSEACILLHMSKTNFETGYKW